MISPNTDSYEARRTAGEVIEKNCQDKIVECRPLNQYRHWLIRTAKGMRYYMLFKRELFHTFSNQFPDAVREGTQGESINKEWLILALRMNVEGLIFVHKRKTMPFAVNYVGGKEFWTWAKNSSTIRETKSHETTMSIPQEMLKRWR